jgi:HAD superfamily hydrolase (TIGR01509 family)
MIVKGSLFDLDGTLFDTLPANKAAYSRAFSEVGLPFDDKKFDRLFGLAFKEIMCELAPNATEPLLGRIRSCKDQEYRNAVPKLRPNHELINWLKYTSGFTSTALVTTARKISIEPILDYFKLKNIFEVVVTGDDIKKGKPDPSGYLKACELLGIVPSEMIAYEDSAHGITAAINAGCRVFQIPRF